MTVPGPDGLGLAIAQIGGPMPEFTLLATDKVRFVGDPVALVVASSRYVAEDACELIEVDYDDLPPVLNAEDALDPAGPRVFENLDDNIAAPRRSQDFGDVAGTFAAADRVVEFTIRQHRHQNVPMEGKACVASFDPWGEAPKAFVALRPGATVTDDELVAFARQRIAAYKVPKTIARVPELPHTASGKVMRRALRDQEVGK